MVRPLPRAAVVGGMTVGILAISISAILARWAMGDTPGVLRATPGTAPALAVAFWRTALGSLALAPLALRSQRRGDGVPIRPRMRQLAGAGLALGLHFALFQAALALTTVASAVTLATMSPIFVALGGWWFLRERTDRRMWIGMAMTIVGAVTVGLADFTGLTLGPRALGGDALAFGSALAVTGYLLVGRSARSEVAATTYSAVVYAWAAGSLLIVCLALGVPLVGYTPITWLAIVGIVIGPQLLGHTVFNTMLSTVPATVVSIAILAEPVGAGILAWLLLGEAPAGWFYLGAPLVLVGVVVATVRRRTAREAAEVVAVEG